MDIHLSGCQEGLQNLRRLAEDAGSYAGLDKVHLNRIVLALDELFANIHEHGYCNRGGNIDCSGQWLGEGDTPCQLEVVLRDFAPTIKDASRLHGVTPESLKDNPVAGGLGLYLIHATTERFEHTPLADGNQWRLLFNVHGKREEK